MAARVSRSATAKWHGTTSEGAGQIAFGSGAFSGPYDLKARVEDEPSATNPEEMIAAASAGCFTMALSSMFEEEGTPVELLETDARVRLEQRDEGFRITRITLTLTGKVPGVSAEHFAELAEQAKASCPVSIALSGTEIVLKASLS